MPDDLKVQSAALLGKLQQIGQWEFHLVYFLPLAFEVSAAKSVDRVRLASHAVEVWLEPSSTGDFPGLSDYMICGL